MKTPPYTSLRFVYLFFFIWLLPFSNTSAQSFPIKHALLIDNTRSAGTKRVMDNSKMNVLRENLYTNSVQVAHLREGSALNTLKAIKTYDNILGQNETAFIYFRGFVGFSEKTEYQFVLLPIDADNKSKSNWIYPEDIVNHYISRSIPVVLIIDGVPVWSPVKIDKSHEPFYDAQFSFPKNNTLLVHLYLNHLTRSSFYIDHIIPFVKTQNNDLRSFANYIHNSNYPGALMGQQSGSLNKINFGRSRHSSIPEFWPVPPASARHRITSHFSNCSQLKNVDSAIKKALESCGYAENSYFKVPEGFAVITKMERINRDASPVPPPKRWDTEVNVSDGFSLTRILRAIFVTESGKFRIIAFVVTPVPFSQSGPPPSEKEAQSWFRVGVSKLPPEIGDMTFTNDYDIFAMIYEFEKREEDPSGKFIQISQNTGEDHLIQSRILSHLE